MSEQTVGSFLREKLTNMANWVDNELGTPSTVNLKQYVAGRTETEIAFIAGLLSTNSNLIAHKDWSGLARLGDIPAEMKEIFHAIRKRDDMHDKFWRYLHLFAEVISNSE